mgnify:CR=1 FL=1
MRGPGLVPVARMDADERGSAEHQREVGGVVCRVHLVKDHVQAQAELSQQPGESLPEMPAGTDTAAEIQE